MLKFIAQKIIFQQLGQVPSREHVRLRNSAIMFTISRTGAVLGARASHYIQYCTRVSEVNIAPSRWHWRQVRSDKVCLGLFPFAADTNHADVIVCGCCISATIRAVFEAISLVSTKSKNISIYAGCGALSNQAASQGHRSLALE